MSVVSVGSAHIPHIESEYVAVEVDTSRGLYSFSIVGLPDKSIDESKDRVIAAIKNSGLKNPKTENHKVVVSLLPADAKKEGSHFDLPIAIGYLLSSKQLSANAKDAWFVGELSLTGELQPMRGALSIAEKAARMGIKKLFVPNANKEEAALVSSIDVYGCKTLRDVVRHFGGLREEDDIETFIPKTPPTEIAYALPKMHLDMADIRGQETAKRALEIAASGGHNIALYGPPGTGKTMLAKAFAGILPPLSREEIFEVTRIHSIAYDAKEIIAYPPIRSPHHTASYVSIVGGGTNPRPGEVTLAHRGVLFLDEFPEFEKRVIESLREPLEEGSISVSRAKGTYRFPAQCILVAAMNPCPCGYAGSNAKRCVCSRGDIERYAKKLSGPIVDRIDIWVPVQNIDYDMLSKKSSQEKSEDVARRIKSVRAFADNRFRKSGARESLRINKDMQPKDFDEHLNIDDDASILMKEMSRKSALSPRGYHRVLRVARTIADMEESERIAARHVLEAFQYRPKLYDNML